MTYDEIVTMIEEVGLPCAYDHYAEGESPDLPYLLFLLPSSDNFFALLRRLSTCLECFAISSTATSSSIYVYSPKNIKDQCKDFSYEAVLTYCDEVSYVKKGPFRKEEEVPTGFIIVDTQNLNLPDYEDGDICYMIDALEIPITRKMLSSPIYIRTRRQPVFVSKKPGLKLTTAKLND